MPFPYDDDQDDESGGRRGSPMGYAQSANVAGNVAARPGYNADLDPAFNPNRADSEYRAPGDGKGPSQMTSMRGVASDEPQSYRSSGMESQPSRSVDAMQPQSAGAYGQSTAGAAQAQQSLYGSSAQPSSDAYGRSQAATQSQNMYGMQSAQAAQPQYGGRSQAQPQGQARPMPAQAQGNAYGRSMAPQQAAMRGAQVPTQGAQAGVAGKAAAGGGMNPMLLGAIASYMQQQQQQREMGREGQQQIAQQFAGSTGYPQYGVQAAQQRQAMNDAEGTDYISEILRMRQQRGR